MIKRELPNGWRQKVIAELVSIKKGNKITNSYVCSTENCYPIINIENLRGVSPKMFSDDNNGIKCSKQDVLIVWDGANSGTVGTNIEGYVGSTIAKLEINNILELDNKYFCYFLKSKFDYLNSRTSGATIPHLDRNSLVSLLVPLPPIETQKKIALVLEKIDNVMQKRKRAYELVDKYLQSVFIEMFINSNSQNKWKTRLISEIAKRTKNSMRTGPFGSDLLHSEFVDKGIPVIGIDNAVNNRFSWGERRYITEEKYKILKRYTVYPNDVIITIMGTTGRSAVIPENIGLAINSKHLAAITLNREIANPYFISYSIHSDPRILAQIRAKNRGAIMNGLNLGIIKNIEFKLPPIDLQNKFAEIVHKVENLKLKQKQSAEELDTLYKSLMQKAFRGELTTEDSSEVVEFSFDTFKKLLKAEFGENHFSFNDILESINKRFGNIEYEKMKSVIYKALERQYDGSCPFLNQILKEVPINLELSLQEKEINYFISDCLR